jgi:carnitine-CoA ligase
MLDIEGLTVSDLLRQAGRRTPDAPFVRFGDDVYTFGDVDDAARRYTTSLLAAGVQQGDLVAIMMRNSIAFIEIYAALAHCGAAVVLVNPEYRGYMLEYVLGDAGCRLLVTDADVVPQIEASAANLTALETVLTVGTPASASGVTVTPLTPDPVPTDPVTAARPTDLHCVVYSSGTTGPSKGIMISNAHALVKALEVIRICSFTSDDVLYSPLPLFYSMGLLRGVLSVAITASCIVLRDKFSVSAYWDDVRRSGATVAHSVFSLPIMLASQPPRDDDLQNSLRCMFNAKYDPLFEERFGVRLIEGYGLTEAGNAIYSRPDEEPVPESCGRASDEWQVQLADADGKEVAVGEIGEIQIRPLLPNRIMLGYLNKPEVTVASTRDLWFRTGDLASRDERGFFFYRGRIKEMIRRRGQNISAWEVEQIVNSHESVAESAAIAYPSDIGDDDLRVVVVPAEGQQVDLVSLAAHCERNMPAYMVPRYFEVRTQLPRTPSGRVEKYRLIEQALGDDVLDRGDGTRLTAR